MTEDAIEIRELQREDLEPIVEFAVRAWAPVFASVREVLGEAIFLRLHPDWEADQADAVRSSCTSDDRVAFVAVSEERPVGFVTVALNAFHDGMGAVEILGVDPRYQRRGISARLLEFALDHMRRCGMDIAVVEAGGDPATHLPAPHTKRQASRCCRSPVTSGCSASARTRDRGRRLTSPSVRVRPVGPASPGRHQLTACVPRDPRH